MAIGILIQASLAGQIITGHHWLVTSHRILAEFLPLPAAALVVVAWQVRDELRDGMAMVTSLAVAFALLMAQTGLGFIGRKSPAAIAIHVPLGVALLGLYTAVAVMIRKSPGARVAGVDLHENESMAATATS